MTVAVAAAVAVVVVVVVLEEAEEAVAADLVPALCFCASPGMYLSVVFGLDFLVYLLFVYTSPWCNAHACA